MYGRNRQGNDILLYNNLMKLMYNLHEMTEIAFLPSERTLGKRLTVLNITNLWSKANVLKITYAIWNLVLPVQLNSIVHVFFYKVQRISL